MLRYPDPSAYHVRKKLSQLWGVSSENIVMGNGSNELIDLLIRIFCEPGDSILTSQYAFIAYKICAQAARVKTIEVPMGEDLKFDLRSISELIDRCEVPPKLIFIANPNNPTGTYLSSEDLFQFLDKYKEREDFLIVLDEAYNEFVRAKDYPHLLDKFKEYKNLVILRTMSKVYGLAGLRVGALIGTIEVVDYCNRVRNPFNVNSLALSGLLAALEDTEFLERSIQNNSEGLDYFYDQFQKMGLRYWESQGNFVLFETPRDAKLIYEELLKKGVILRPLAPYGLNTHLRMSVGLPEENLKAIQALSEVLQI